jgi:hypothetical protein
MKPTPFVAIPFLVVFSSCAAVSEEDAPEVTESAQTASNCSFIPGCKDLLEGGDGPFSVSVMTYEAAGRTRRRLSVTYHERFGSSFLRCSQFPRQPSLALVFAFGADGDSPRSAERAMGVSCPSSWGDNAGLENTAGWGILEDEDATFWETLFPRRPDGARWYAVRIAARNADGEWDSRYGYDYRVVLQPR